MFSTEFRSDKKSKLCEMLPSPVSIKCLHLQTTYANLVIDSVANPYENSCNGGG